MLRVSRRLLVAAGIGLLVTIWFLFGQPDPYAPLRPLISPQQAELLAQKALQNAGVPQGQVPQKWQMAQEENAAVERYLQDQGLMDAFVREYGADEPLVVWKLVSVKDSRQEVWVNQQTGRIEAMQGFVLHRPPFTKGAETSGITSLLTGEFHCRLDSNFANQSDRDKSLTVCGTDVSFHGIQSGVVLVQQDGGVIGFAHRVVAPGESLTSEPAGGVSCRIGGGIF